MSSDLFLGSISTPGEGRYLLFINIALDGSGTIGTHKIFAYGGAVGSPKQWEAFAETWFTVLQKYGITYFKMAEAMTWFGEFGPKFTEWGEEREAKREALFEELIDLALRAQFHGSGIFVNASILDERAVADSKTETIKALFVSLLSGIPENHYATVMCDAELDVEPKIRVWMSQLRRLEKQLPSLAGFCFMDERLNPPIQLADIVAWLWRAWGEARLLDPAAQMPPLLARLTKGPVKEYSPGRGELLKTFIDANKNSRLT